MDVNKSACIFCRNNDEELTDEHVIPDSLGGHYHIYNVCKRCNSIIGENVDSKYLNNFITIAYRHQYGIKGKSGKIPHPLVGEYQDDKGGRFKTVYEDGQIVPKIIPSLNVVKDEVTGNLTIHGQFDIKERKNIENIIRKKLKRMGIDPSKRESSVTQIKSENPMLQTKFELDFNHINLELLKIAYEFTVDRVPAYLDDPQSFILKEIVLTQDYVTLNEILPNRLIPIKGTVPFFDELLNPFIDFTRPNRSIIVLFCYNTTLLCYVSLPDNFQMYFKMTECADYLYDNYVCICIDDYNETSPKFFNCDDLLFIIDSCKKI